MIDHGRALSARSIGLAAPAGLAVFIAVATVEGGSKIVIALCFVVAVLAVVAALAAVKALPRTAFELVLAANVTLLPVMPYLANRWPQVSALRFALAALALALLVSRGAVTTRSRRIHAFVAAFALIQTVAAIQSGFSMYSGLRLANWLMFVPFAFFRYDRRAIRIVVAFALVTGCILAGGVVLQKWHLLGGVWGGLALSDTSHATRYTSFLLNPNDLGLFMLGLGVTLFMVATATAHVVRIGPLVAAGVASAVVLLTGSRGALLGLPIVLAWFALTGRWRAAATLAVATIAVVLILPALVPSARASLNASLGSVRSALAGRDPSVQLRQARWRDVFSRPTNFAIGSGYGGYADNASRDVRTSADRRLLYRSLTVDNSWLKLWLEEGALGTLLLIGVIVGAVAIAFRCALSSTSAGVVGALLVLLAVRSATADNLDVNPWNFFLWLLIGLAVSLASDRSETS